MSHQHPRGCVRSKQECNVVYVDPEYGSDKTGELESPKYPFKTYHAAVRAILDDKDHKPARFARWLVKFSNCRINENIELYSWIDLTGESRQGTIIAGQVHAGEKLTLGAESYISNLTVYDTELACIAGNTPGSFFFQNVRLLREVSKNTKCDAPIALVVLKKGNLTIEDSVATLEVASLKNNQVAMYYGAGPGPYNLDVRNTRNFLIVVKSNATSSVSAVLNRGSNPLNSVLSKVNTYKITLPSTKTPVYRQLFSDGGAGKLLSHHESISFDIPVSQTISLINVGDAISDIRNPVFAFFYGSTNLTPIFITQINTAKNGLTSIPLSSIPNAINVELRSNNILSILTSVTSELQWKGVFELFTDKLIGLEWKGTVSAILAHSVSSLNSHVEIVDADVRGIPANYRISKAEGALSQAITHNMRIHDQVVLPRRDDVETNGGKTIDHSLVTDGEHLLGGQEASELTLIELNNQRQLVDNDVTTVISTGKNNIITLPVINPSDSQTRNGTRIQVKNSGSRFGLVGVTTQDGSTIDNKGFIVLSATNAIDIIATRTANKWHILSHLLTGGTIPTYPFNPNLPLNDTLYLQPGQTVPFASFHHKFYDTIIFTVTGAGGGAYVGLVTSPPPAFPPVFPGGGAGGGGASWQFAVDIASAMKYYASFTAKAIGAAGANGTDASPLGTKGGITILAFNGSPNNPNDFVNALGGGAGGIPGLNNPAGGGGGGAGSSDFGGSANEGGKGGAGDPTQGGAGGGGDGGTTTNNGFGRGVLQLEFTQLIPLISDVLTPINGVSVLFTPGAGGSAVAESQSSPIGGGPVGLVNEFVIGGTPFINTGSSGGSSIGAYPFPSPFAIPFIGSGTPGGIGAIVSDDPVLDTPAGPGGGGAMMAGVNHPTNAGPGVIIVYAFKR